MLPSSKHTTIVVGFATLSQHFYSNSFFLLRNIFSSANSRVVNVLRAKLVSALRRAHANHQLDEVVLPLNACFLQTSIEICCSARDHVSSYGFVSPATSSVQSNIKVSAPTIHQKFNDFRLPFLASNVQRCRNVTCTARQHHLGNSRTPLSTCPFQSCIPSIASVRDDLSDRPLTAGSANVLKFPATYHAFSRKALQMLKNVPVPHFLESAHNRTCRSAFGDADESCIVKGRANCVPDRVARRSERIGNLLETHVWVINGRLGQ